MGGYAGTARNFTSRTDPLSITPNRSKKPKRSTNFMKPPGNCREGTPCRFYSFPLTKCPKYFMPILKYYFNMGIKCIFQES
jgi:hypothetical protein